MRIDDLKAELERLEKKEKAVIHLKELAMHKIIYKPVRLKKEDRFVLVNCDKSVEWIEKRVKIKKSAIYEKLQRFQKYKL